MWTWKMHVPKWYQKISAASKPQEKKFTQIIQEKESDILEKSEIGYDPSVPVWRRNQMPKYLMENSHNKVNVEIKGQNHADLLV